MPGGTTTIETNGGTTTIDTISGALTIDTMPSKLASSKAGEQDNDAFLPEGKSGPPTLDDLTGEHRRKYDQVMAGLTEEVLKYFMWTRSGGIKCTGTLESTLDGVDLSVPSEEHS